jgi:hypothetical protein
VVPARRYPGLSPQLRRQDGILTHPQTLSFTGHAPEGAENDSRVRVLTRLAQLAVS